MNLLFFKTGFRLRSTILLLLTFYSISSLKGQTTLISPTADGGFENGSTLAANGWTAVNAGTNQWIIGTATKSAGSYSAYISNNGSSNTYTANTANTSHFYKDITVPAGETTIELSFYLKGAGEVGYDRLLVYTAPTSVTPASGTPASNSTTLTGATLIYTQTATFATYSQQTILLPASLSGTTFRLIFTWQNDNNTRTNPPAAIDNISLISAGGTNTWVGAIYDGTNFATYNGYYTIPTETFDENFGGGDDGNYTIASNSTVITKSTFSVRYTMQSNRKGLYTADLGSDDGSRLYVDGNQVYNNWINQAWGAKPRVLFSLTGNSLLTYEFYENTGGNQVTYANQTLVLANQLSTNTTQSIQLGSSGVAISGDAFGTLPTGISLNGTGYQWYYSTTPGGTKTLISGATGASYTPTTSAAPFNAFGTYYLFRYASLISTNNTGVTNYTPTNVSNAAEIHVVGITSSTATLTNFTYVYDNGPSTEQTFTVTGNGLSDDIRISPPASYEISCVSGSGYRSVPLIVNGLSTTTVYVRLKKSLDIGTYNSQEIVLSSTGVNDKKVTCSGKVIGPTIIVGYKSGTTTDNNYGMGGVQRAYADDKLTNSANFGPNGISPYTFVLYDFGTNAITEAALNANGVKILDMGLNNYDAGYGNTTQSYTTSEINEIKNWTTSTRDHVVLAFQGATSALGGASYLTNGTGNQNPNSIVGKGLKVFNGPFPVPSGNSYNQAGTYQGTYTTYPSSACILTEASNGRATGLINITTGDIYLADVGLLDQVDNDNTRDELTQSANITSQTDAFYANLYHSMARIVQYMPTDICDFFSCGAGVNAPVLSASYTSVNCATQTTNINNLSVNAPPGTSTLVWFTNPNRTGTAYATPTAATIGTYYAFYYNAADNCYSPASLPLVVQTGIALNTTTLTGFSYVAGSGPSAPQLFTVSGSCLSNNVTITVPANYEISLDGTTYQSTDIILSQIAGSVDITNIYVRLKAGLTANAYTGNISVSSSGAATKYIDVLGSVSSVSNCASAGTTTNQTSITYVQLNTISNASAKSAGYTNYSSFYTTIEPGKTYPLSTRLNTAGNNTLYCIAWIDWNRDGDFADAGEEFQLGTVTNSVNGLTSLSPKSVTVPAGASIGLTKMRVACKVGAYPTACENGFDGEVEDYMIYIAKNYWRGNISSDWSDANNWTAGFVPATNDDIVYSTGSPYSIAVRDLMLDQNRTIGSLTNSTTNALVIPPAVCLTVNNTVTTDNNPDRIQIKSSQTQANGSLVFALPASNSSVQATVEMYSKGQWDLAQPDGSKYFWQFFGIPVKNVVANPTFYMSIVRKPDEAGSRTNHWVQLTNESVLDAFQGYEITQLSPKTLFFQGELVTSNFSKTNLAYTATAGFPGQYLFANSYTAAIDISKLGSAFGSNVEPAIYLYNSGTYNQWVNNSGETTGSTTATTAGTYTVSTPATAGIGGVPLEIPSMQAFLVKVTSNNPANSYLNFNYSTVAKNNSELQRIKRKNSQANSSDNETDKSYMHIIVSGKQFADQMWLFVNSTCSHAYDAGWDGRKMIGSPRSPSVYAMEEDGEYQIDAVSNISGTSIGFAPGQEEELSMAITQNNLTTKYDGLFLKDLVTNKIIKIEGDTLRYKFTATANTSAAKRFMIFATNAPFNQQDSQQTVKIRSYIFDRNVIIENLSDQTGTAWLYDISGRLIKQAPIKSTGITQLASLVPYGTYIVKIMANGLISKNILISK